ncbi:hypothetical protein SAMN05216573_11371 [Bradyrhizobium sp. Rc3b]|nr:hypothetical protein SAMN05216573_11371 [Bradyrhizobium sp. Rc3b]
MTAHAEANLADELTAHAVASIEAADHFALPFPHIVFRDFFPADSYQYRVRHAPDRGVRSDHRHGNAHGSAPLWR